MSIILNVSFFFFLVEMEWCRQLLSPVPARVIPRDHKRYAAASIISIDYRSLRRFLPEDAINGAQARKQFIQFPPPGLRASRRTGVLQPLRQEFHSISHRRSRPAWPLQTFVHRHINLIDLESHPILYYTNNGFLKTEHCTIKWITCVVIQRVVEYPAELSYVGA